METPAPQTRSAITYSACVACSAASLDLKPLTTLEEYDPPFCSRCRSMYPPVLLKAMVDNPFNYEMELVNGTRLMFEGASIIGPNWIHLDSPILFDIDTLSYRSMNGLQYKDRGIDIALSSIAWVADGNA